MDGGAGGLRYPWDKPPAGIEAIEVAEGVLWMRLPLPMKLDHVNVYALDDGDGWTIVDTGFKSREARELLTAMMAGPLAGKPVTRVVVTHHHPDHIGNAGWFQTEHGAELVTTRTAWLMARMLCLDVQETPPAETVAFWRSAGMTPEVLEKRIAGDGFHFRDVVSKMPPGFTRVKQGDVIRMGGRDWDVHIGNGHAPEHATFWSRDDNLVIAGDQILSSISPNLSIYANEPEADPVGDWLESCERLATLALPGHMVLGGHKMVFTGLPVRLRQMIDNHRHGLDRLLEHLDEPKTASDCFPPLFKRKIGEGEYGLALFEAMAHAQHLYLTGQVVRERRADGAWLYVRAT
ncbi:MBL fold metallo-hydrolase [Chachezhania antarctica]|uniref:MBL fold metallo-hydrolase n=1 Tax=Chachezhania antarctica TaxID=2340860 RepID=UPI000EB186E0|nr:MBL fold metallo-hydrolase [Chachezhania antarctica]